jgi:hypothetical protein
VVKLTIEVEVVISVDVAVTVGSRMLWLPEICEVVDENCAGGLGDGKLMKMPRIEARAIVAMRPKIIRPFLVLISSWNPPSPANGLEEACCFS